MTIKTASTLLLSAIVLTGCATIGAPSSEGDPIQLDALGSDAVLVMRVRPDSRVHVTPGIQTNEGWWTTNETPWQNPVAVNAFPDKDGFIVARVKATTGTQLYGVARMVPKSNALFKSHYFPCVGNLTPTFPLPPGKVTYVGTVIADDVSRDNKEAAEKGRSAAQEDLAEVKAKLSLNYPKVATAMESRPFALRQVTKGGECHFISPLLLPNRKPAQ